MHCNVNDVVVDVSPKFPQFTLYPPFHTGTAIRIVPGLWHSHKQIVPGSIRIKIQITNRGSEHYLDLDSCISVQ